MATILNKIPLLDTYDNYFKLQLTENIKEITFGQNEYIIREGDEATAFYIILEGSVEVLKSYEDDKKKGNLRVRDLKEYTHFGEVGILSHCKRTMSVRVTSHTCNLAKMTKEAFSRIVFSIESNLRKDYDK